MDDARISTSEQLMAEMRWVRELARALVKDRAVADDVAQDTWLVAHAQQPDADRPLRPWLARVVVNLVRTRRRGEARRDARDAAVEAAAGLGRVVPTPAELVERVELQRAVADEVLALAEPYRSTVLLHFVEGLSSAEIAHQLAIPAGTVRRRLKVALDQLREALRVRSHPPKRGWLAALLPLAQLPGGGGGVSAAPIAAGVFAMKKVLGGIAVVVLVVLALLGGSRWWHRDDGGGGGGGGPASGDGSASEADAHTRHGGSGRAALGPGAIPDWLLQAGAPARRIAGRVIANGAPIAGARVQLGFEVTGEPTSSLVSEDSLPSVLQPIAEVTSAADGTFDFGPQPGAAFTVSAVAAGWSAAAVKVANADPRVRPDQLVLALGECRGRMSGTISDASGGGIAKARISVAGLAGVESSSTGAYRVCLSPMAILGTPVSQVRIEAAGYGTITLPVLVIGELHQDFLLVPEAVLAGRVTTSDGQPVAGARVIARLDPSELPHHVASGWTMSDADGKFRIAGLAPGAFELFASARGLVISRPVSAFAQPATTSRELHLVLAATTRVRGHVVMDGRPLGGVVVMAAHGRPPAVTGMSQADGSFALELPPGTNQLFASPYELVSPKSLEVGREPPADLTLEVHELASLRGHITRGGKPVAGANIRYIGRLQGGFNASPQAVSTDATGAYAIEGLPAGAARVIAWDDHSKSFAFQPVELAAGEAKTVDVSLDYAGAVQGTVVDAADQPVAGVYVRMDVIEGGDDMCEAMTDARGQFDCSMLTGGDYRPTVAPTPGGRQGFAPASGDRLAIVHVPADRAITGVKLAVADERLAIAGRVVDDTGAAVPDAHVEAIGRGLSGMAFPSAMTDADGHFAIRDLARGSYNLHAHAADGSEAEAMGIAAGSDAAVVTLARAGAIDGTLAGFSTPPMVRLETLTPDLRLGGIATVDGTTFSKLGLSPGRYTVQATAGAEVDGQSVEIRPGETAHVTLRSRGTGTVTGTVTELGTHAPIPGMRCDAILSMGGQMSGGPPDESQQAFADATGHFTVTAPLGRVRIWCFVPTGGPFSGAGADVDVASGTPASVTVFSVRATSGGAPGEAGFILAPMELPLTVNGVLPGGPAASAGMLVGDRVVAIDDTPMTGLMAPGAMALLGNHKPGTVATVTVERANATRVLRITITARGP